MDTVWTANTGIWISFAVSSLLLVPVILEFGKRNLPVLFGIIAFILALRGMSPQSPEMQIIWVQMQQIPGILYTLLRQAIGGFFP